MTPSACNFATHKFLWLSSENFKKKFSWHIIMRMRAPKEGSCDPIAPLELPHAMHAFNRVSSTDKLNLVSFMLFLFILFCFVHVHNYVR